MNFDNEKLSPHLYKIDSSKLLLLDFGKFDKKDYSYVCQDFDDSFYHALAALKEHLRKYQRLVLFISRRHQTPPVAVVSISIVSVRIITLIQPLWKIQTGYKSVKEKYILQSVR